MRSKRDRYFTKFNQNKPTTMIPTGLQERDKYISKSKKFEVDIYSFYPLTIHSS